MALFYGTLFGMTGTHLPFFTVWLKAVGIDAFWIGLITAVPPVTRFTVLPLVTGLAERRQALRGGIIVTAFATALGFFILGTQHLPVLVFLIYALTCCLWTPMVPLTDAYALRGVKRYGLNYGPLRLWGSAAFVLGALVCGVLFDLIAARNLIWIIAGSAAIGALASLALQPLDDTRTARPGTGSASALLRDGGFIAVIVASALIQGSHAAYYIFASIAWQQAGFDGLTIASPVGPGRDCRDRAVRAVAAVHPAAVDAGGDRGTERGRALDDNGAGSAAGCSRDRPAHACAELRADAGRNHGIDAASRARPCDGARARLSDRLRRHRRRPRVDRVGHDLRELGPGHLLRDGCHGRLGGLVVWLARDRLSHQPHKAASGG